MRRVAKVIVCVATLSTAAHAQQPRDTAPASPTAAFGLELGVGTQYAGRFAAMSGHCTAPGFSLAGTALARLLRVVVVEAALGGHTEIGMPWGCEFLTAAPAAPSGAADSFAARRVVRGRDPSDGFVATTVRAGLELPPTPGLPLSARLTAGAGRMWNPGIPFRTLRASITSGGRRARVVVSTERWWYGLAVEGFTGEPPERRQRVVPDAVRRFRVRQTSLRVGLETPLGWR